MVREDLVTGRAQSGDREPAPDDLRLVQDFVNTVDRENVVELLDAPRGLREWLEHRGLPGAAEELTDADVRRAVTLREALRTLLLANNGGADDARARATVAGCARRSRLEAEVL